MACGCGASTGIYLDDKLGRELFEMIDGADEINAGKAEGICGLDAG